jgi:hypothetical protein
MDGVRELFCSENSGSSRVRQQVNSQFRNVLASLPSHRVEVLALLCFGSDSIELQPELLQLLSESVSSSSFKDQFLSVGSALVDDNNWLHSQPSFSAFSNFCFFINSPDLFVGRVSQFLFLVTQFLFDFPSRDKLTFVIELYLQHLDNISFQLPDELADQVDDAFQLKHPQTILATCLIKLGKKLLSLAVLNSVFKLAIIIIVLLFSEQDLTQKRADMSIVFPVALQPE